MKKILLSFLSLMGLGFPAFAQSHINIELLSATYTTPAVQFRVSWDAIPEGVCHNSKIWLWVDFIKIENNQPSGSWTRATVAHPSPGTVAEETNKGFWLQGNAGNYTQIVTVALTNIPANTTFNWCAYASDCPPNVTFDKGTYTFKGTTNFIVNSPAQTITTKTIAKADLTVNSSSTFTDATACPGTGSLYCPYTGSDLFMDATHLCQQRTSGAQNWEAWIKDSRDEQIYHIVQIDNTWWFTDDLNINEKVSGICNNVRFYHPENRPDCPSGWAIPTKAMYMDVYTGNGCGDKGMCWEPISQWYCATGVTCLGSGRQQNSCYTSPGQAVAYVTSDCNTLLLIWWQNESGTGGGSHPCHMSCTDSGLPDAGFVRCFRQL
ncbi:MAG: hypothetical protein LBF81_00085 [Prevotellaceae bacterium]|jgi:hypothetical protein|nr:hypothetical protein [Prevotellaceae bacterium]